MTVPAARGQVLAPPLTIIPDPDAGPVRCANCGKREGTIQWVGEGGLLAYTHGFGAMWCEVCTLGAQLAYARRQAASIPDLEAKLAAAEAAS